MVHRVSYTLAGQELILETGRLAKQANGSVYAQFGGSAVIATACASSEAREGLDFVPVKVATTIAKKISVYADGEKIAEINEKLGLGKAGRYNRGAALHPRRGSRRSCRHSPFCPRFWASA